MGAALALAVLRYRPGLRTAMITSLVASFWLGALNAAFADLPALLAFVGVGVLGTAASFVLVTTGGRPAMTTFRSGWHLFRRTATVMTLQAMLCIGFVGVGYLSVYSAVVLYGKFLAG